MKTIRIGDMPAHHVKLIEALREYARAEMEESGRVRPVIVGTDGCDLRVAVHKPRTKDIGGGEPPA